MPAPHVNRRPLSKSADKPVVNVVLDSGAFSAWKLNKPILIDEYCDYLLENQDWIAHYVNLDVINLKDPEAAARASFDNLLYMRKRGLTPMPVYHVGEHGDWLKRMLDVGIDYVGLSASSLVSRSQVDDWYGFAHSQIIDANGLPIVKTHAFGEGRFESLRKFPWMSADSTTWIHASEMAGTLVLADGRKVAMRNDGVSTNNATDIDHLDEIDFGVFQQFAADAGIKDVSVFSDRGREGSALRLYMTAKYYQAQVRKLNASYCPIRYKPFGLFNTHSTKHAAPPVHIPAMNFYLVISGTPLSYVACAYAKHQHVLASYFHVRSTAHHKMLKPYAYDPMHVAKTYHTFARFSEILEKYIDEKH